jgi:hypothetical protein
MRNKRTEIRLFGRSIALSWVSIVARLETLEAVFGRPRLPMARMTSLRSFD